MYTWSFLLTLFGFGLSAKAQRVFPLDSSSTRKHPVYASVQQAPSFPGGMSQLGAYIRKHMPSSKTPLKQTTGDRAYVTFIVNENGALQHVRLIKGLEPTFDAQVLRLIKGMPRWIPGKIDGQAVACRYSLPIKR